MFLFGAPSFSEDGADTRIPSPQLTTITSNNNLFHVANIMVIMSVHLSSTANLRFIEVTSYRRLLEPSLSFAGCANVTSRCARLKLHSGIHSLRIISLPASASIISDIECTPASAPGCQCMSRSNTERRQWPVKNINASSFDDDVPFTHDPATYRRSATASLPAPGRHPFQRRSNRSRHSNTADLAIGH